MWPFARGDRDVRGEEKKKERASPADQQMDSVSRQRGIGI